MTQEQDIVERLENDGSSWAQPLFNEAAQTIAALRAERDALRKALERISEDTHIDAFNVERPSYAATIARTAIGDKP